MPGLYTHTTRANDLILDATVYNGDHQNHIDNADAANMGGHSANATQMQATTDPGEVSSENLAASVADELERLRFIIKEMKNSTQWYTSTETRIRNLGFYLTNVTDGIVNTNQVADSKVMAANTSWYVDTSYVSGDLTFTWYYRAESGSNDVAFQWVTLRGRSGSASNTIDNSVAATTTMSTTNVQTITRTVASAQFQAGDVITNALVRAGTSGADTNTGVLVIYGVTISYTAYAGRP